MHGRQSMLILKFKLTLSHLLPFYSGKTDSAQFSVSRTKREVCYHLVCNQNSETQQTSTTERFVRGWEKR